MGESGRALDGVRVLDLTHQVAGPSATLMLAFLGAEVVKVIAPGSRDSYDPIPFYLNNASKKSVELDLKSADGLRTALRLAERADIFVENFSPGVIDRLGLGWDVLSRAQPPADLRAAQGVRRGLAVPGLPVLRPDRAGVRRRVVDHRGAGRAADEAGPGRGRHRHRDDAGPGDPRGAVPAGEGRARPARADRDDRPGGDVHADPLRLADRPAHGHPAVREPAAVPRHHRAVRHLPVPAVRAERLRAHPLRQRPPVGADGQGSWAARTCSATRGSRRWRAAASTRPRSTRRSAPGPPRWTRWPRCARSAAPGCRPARCAPRPRCYEDADLRERGIFVTVDDPGRGAVTIPGYPVRMSRSPARVAAPPRPGQHTAEVLREWLGEDADGRRASRTGRTGEPPGPVIRRGARRSSASARPPTPRRCPAPPGSSRSRPSSPPAPTPAWTSRDVDGMCRFTAPFETVSEAHAGPRARHQGAVVLRPGAARRRGARRGRRARRRGGQRRAGDVPSWSTGRCRSPGAAGSAGPTAAARRRRPGGSGQRRARTRHRGPRAGQPVVRLAVRADVARPAVRAVGPPVRQRCTG